MCITDDEFEFCGRHWRLITTMPSGWRAGSSRYDLLECCKHTVELNGHQLLRAPDVSDLAVFFEILQRDKDAQAEFEITLALPAKFQTAESK